MLRIEAGRSCIAGSARFGIEAKNGVAAPFDNAKKGFAQEGARLKIQQVECRCFLFTIVAVADWERIKLTSELYEPQRFAVGLEGEDLAFPVGPTPGQFVAVVLRFAIKEQGGES